MSDLPIVIVGAGTTGAAAAYHLAVAGAASIVIVDRGTVGRGASTSITVPPVPASSPDAPDLSYQPAVSGSAVFEGGSAGPSTIKMVISLPPYKSVAEFEDHHGRDGTLAYLESAARGRDTLVALAGRLLPRPETQLRTLGSMMVTDGPAAELAEEYERLQALGCECSWMTTAAVAAAHGPDAAFTAGIHFPHDAIVDSTAYAEALLAAAAAISRVTVLERVAVSAIHDRSAYAPATVVLDDGRALAASAVVVATGGGFLDASLAGILTPCFSYLTALRHCPRPNSPNFFTYGFSHDWSFADGFVRISGEDHYSGLKRPRWRQRCERLAEWGWRKYPFVRRDASYPTKYGLYSETPDSMPLVGPAVAGSAVVYMVGCNAWGQASLSAAAELAPGLLGLRPLTDAQARTAALFDIRRFSGKTRCKL